VEGDWLTMQYDEDKVDEMVLALLYLNTYEDRFGVRAWKESSWDSLDRLHAKGFIGNPKSKARSVPMTEVGRRRAKELCKRHFSA
jgi:hypothetical protein